MQLMTLVDPRAQVAPTSRHLQTIPAHSKRGSANAVLISWLRAATAQRRAAAAGAMFRATGCALQPALAADSCRAAM